MTLRAILFDAGNTLVFLDHARMADAVAAALGVTLTGAELAAAAPAAARSVEGLRATDRDRADAYLTALFTLAGVPEARLEEVRTLLAALHTERHLWGSVAPGTRDALLRLGRRFRLGVVSNSDGRVEAALEAAGLRDCFEVVVDSGLLGVEKPDPAIFHAALERLRVEPHEALYVGDLYHVDVIGARAAGMDAVLYAPGEAPNVTGCRTVGSIAALVDLLLPGERAVS